MAESTAAASSNDALKQPLHFRFLSRVFSNAGCIADAVPSGEKRIQKIQMSRVHKHTYYTAREEISLGLQTSARSLYRSIGMPFPSH